MRSMTGFGRAKLERETREYIIEIRSVNHKYTDINIKAPKNLFYVEEKVRKTILNKIYRGKLDVYITYNNFGIKGRKVLLNHQLAETYINELQTLANNMNIDDKIHVTEISKMPDVLNVEEDEEMQEVIAEEIVECLNKALDNLLDMRIQEGSRIKEDLLQRIGRVEENVNKISQYSTGLVQEYIVKLEKRIKEILQTDIIDQNRLAQETVIYADKSSVEEELTRLKSHVMQFRHLMEQEGTVGKKLDFLIQEMNRETNTIGSKSGSIDITNLVIEIKTQLEDIREQIQNIE